MIIPMFQSGCEREGAEMFFVFKGGRMSPKQLLVLRRASLGVPVELWPNAHTPWACHMQLGEESCAHPCRSRFIFYLGHSFGTRIVGEGDAPVRFPPFDRRV